MTDEEPDEEPSVESIMFVDGEDGRAALEHLQILLGYGFTGHTSNQATPCSPALSFSLTASAHDYVGSDAFGLLINI